MPKIKLLALFICSCLIFTPPLSWGETNNNATTNPSVSERINDSAITAKVKAAFILDNEIKGLSISVNTEKGVVTLSGTVDNFRQKEKAVELARQIHGVNLVRDEIIVKPVMQ